LFVTRPKMRGSSREEPCNDGLIWYNISFKPRFLGCYAKENSVTVRKLWHGPWPPALVHNSMTVVPYLNDIKSVMGPYFVSSVLFPWLPTHPTKMCPVMTRHILVLPRHKFLCLIIHTLWTCLLHAPSLCNRTQILGLGIIYHFLKMTNWAQGPARRKRYTQLYCLQ
jgi:hypothetical protein